MAPPGLAVCRPATLSGSSRDTGKPLGAVRAPGTRAPAVRTARPGSCAGSCRKRSSDAFRAASPGLSPTGPRPRTGPPCPRFAPSPSRPAFLLCAHSREHFRLHSGQAGDERGTGRRGDEAGGGGPQKLLRSRGSALSRAGPGHRGAGARRLRSTEDRARWWPRLARRLPDLPLAAQRPGRRTRGPKAISVQFAAPTSWGRRPKCSPKRASDVLEFSGARPLPGARPRAS